jgi:hypothetical protein
LALDEVISENACLIEEVMADMAAHFRHSAFYVFFQFVHADHMSSGRRRLVSLDSEVTRNGGARQR